MKTVMNFNDNYIYINIYMLIKSTNKMYILLTQLNQNNTSKINFLLYKLLSLLIISCVGK